MNYTVPDGLYYKLQAAVTTAANAELRIEMAERDYRDAMLNKQQVEMELRNAITENGKYETVGEIVIDETHRDVERKLVMNE